MGKASVVWKYFHKSGDGSTTCKLCGKQLKTSGNTSNLLGHITRLHKNHINLDEHEQPTEVQADVVNNNQHQDFKIHQ
jgi:hypothetical protein